MGATTDTSLERTRDNSTLRVAGLIFMLAVPACAPGRTSAVASDACTHFFSALDQVPHLSLTRRDGTHESLRDGRTHDGCEIRFETSVALMAGRGMPDFTAAEGTETHGLGWRENDLYLADGPGTGSYGIEKGATLCLVAHEQPAYLGDDGSIVQSETLRITIQCRDRPQP